MYVMRLAPRGRRRRPTTFTDGLARPPIHRGHTTHFCCTHVMCRISLSYFDLIPARAASNFSPYQCLRIVLDARLSRTAI